MVSAALGVAPVHSWPAASAPSLVQAPVEALFARWTALRYEATLAMLGTIGAIVYAGAVLALFGREWLALFQRRAASPANRI